MSLVVTVDKKQIADGEYLLAPEESFLIEYDFPFEEGKLYTVYIGLDRLKRGNISNSYCLLLLINYNVGGLAYDTVIDDPFVFPMKTEEIQSERDYYNVIIYEQKSFIDAHNGVLRLIYKREVIGGIKIKRVVSIRFNVHPPLIPSNFSMELLNHLPIEFLWKIISDYNIDMKKTPFFVDKVIERIKEWADNYMANRKL